MEMLLVAAPVLAAAAIGWIASWLREARLLTLRAGEARQFQRLAARIRELSETALAVRRGDRPREAFALAQLRLAESLAAIADDLPGTGRLLLLEAEPEERVRAQARAALAEVTDLVRGSDSEPRRRTASPTDVSHVGAAGRRAA